MLLQDLHVVVKVSEFKSITAAASHLDMRTATASAAVKRVEAELRAELFIRTTRSLRLSSVGERYIPLCQQALSMLDNARQSIHYDLDKIEEELRIAVSSDLGRNYLMGWLEEFMVDHPKASLRISVSDSNIDFYRDAIDLAFRYGSPVDTNLYGFKICHIPRLLCATPEYLDKHGIPKHPQELSKHNGLFYQLQDSVHNVWTFKQKGREYKVKMSGNRVSDDAELVRRWCVASQGLAIKSSLDMSNDLLSGALVNVMPEFEPTPTELWLVYPSRQTITPAIRLLRDAIREKSLNILKRLEEQGFLKKSV